VGLILDSSVVISGERRGQTVRQILEQLEMVYGAIDIGLSVVSVAELMHGAYRAGSDSRLQQRLAFIERLCMDVPVYPLTVEIARTVGRIEGLQAAKGIMISFEDLVIGAPPCNLDLGLQRLNVRDFARIPDLAIAAL